MISDTGFYILNDKREVIAATFEEHAKFFEGSVGLEKFRVASEELCGVNLVTLFTGEIQGDDWDEEYTFVTRVIPTDLFEIPPEGTTTTDSLEVLSKTWSEAVENHNRVKLAIISERGEQ